MKLTRKSCIVCNRAKDIGSVVVTIFSRYLVRMQGLFAGTRSWCSLFGYGIDGMLGFRCF